MSKATTVWRSKRRSDCAIANPGQAYQSSGYTYTDAYGRVYTIGPDGALQSLKDLNGNTLTITANGITSSSGLSAPFMRDAQGRITQITDTLGNHYVYTYDASGNLSTATLPSVAQLASSPAAWKLRACRPAS